MSGAPPPRVSAVILAAGAGARMGGRAKGALRLPDGRTFLAAILDGASRAGCVDAVVVVAPPHAAETRAAAPAGTRFVDNPAPERGMISSIAVGIEAKVDADAVLVWPVDLPLASRAAARVVAAAARGVIVVPRRAGRNGHPTAFGADTFAELAAAGAAAASDGARGVVRRNPSRVIHVEVDDPGIFIDVDTLADYDRINEVEREP